eukprot:1160429-Pelagomonas_calceolata.AAC.17
MGNYRACCHRGRNQIDAALLTTWHNQPDSASLKSVSHLVENLKPMLQWCIKGAAGKLQSAPGQCSHCACFIYFAMLMHALQKQSRTTPARGQEERKGNGYLAGLSVLIKRSHNWQARLWSHQCNAGLKNLTTGKLGYGLTSELKDPMTGKLGYGLTSVLQVDSVEPQFGCGQRNKQRFSFMLSPLPSEGGGGVWGGTSNIFKIPEACPRHSKYVKVQPARKRNAAT